MDLDSRAKEISEYLSIDFSLTKQRLNQGFHFNHAKVADDFIGNGTNVNDNNSLLNWYKKTDSYIWELSSYHLDPGFNYMGMCDGLAIGMRSAGKNRVISLGDGIGDLSLRIAREGLDATYHDLKDSKTANFAMYRFQKAQDVSIKTKLTEAWDHNLGTGEYDAVIALDFFEHLVNVDQWVKAVYSCLDEGGVFIAQNAFAIGDLEHGNSIPMHLSINNKYEKEWGTLLTSTGFALDPNSGWWVKK